MNTKTIRGWVIVNKRGTPFGFSFGITRHGAQFNFVEAMTLPLRSPETWPDYEAQGFTTARATMIVEIAVKAVK